MRTRHIACWLVALCGINAVAAGRANLTSIRGHVVAIRPAERLGQVVSGVVNRETFLLRVDGKAGEIVKVVYEHDGYSELTGAAAERNAGLALEVRRDRSCDGNYGQFVSEAPVMTSEDKTESIPPVTMLEDFNGLPQSYKLKCYRLARGNIRRVAPVSNPMRVPPVPRFWGPGILIRCKRWLQFEFRIVL